MWSRYLFDVCTRKIHLCAFLIYGRQTGWKTTNHGNQPWLRSNGRLRLESKPNTIICLSGSFVLYRDSSGKWCHASLEPKIYKITGHIEKVKTIILWLLSRAPWKPVVSKLSEENCYFHTHSLTLLKDTLCSISSLDRMLLLLSIPCKHPPVFPV